MTFPQTISNIVADMNNTNEEITTLVNDTLNSVNGTITGFISKDVKIEELEEFKNQSANRDTRIEDYLEEFKKQTVNNFLIVDNQINNNHCSLLDKIENTNKTLQAELKNIRLKVNIGFAVFVLLNLGIIIYLVLK